jgi:hypothetical protein
VANFIPYGNLGVFDEFVQTLDVAAFETPLMRVCNLVHWEVFDPLIQGAVTLERKGPGGRPMTPQVARSQIAAAFAPFSD